MLGLVERRERVFDEVIQDICALVLRRRPADAPGPCRCLRLRSEHDPVEPEARGGVQPQAPRTWPRFRTFLKELCGLGEDPAKMYWLYAIRLTRSYNISDGLQMHERVTEFLLDPDTIVARRGGDQALADLWAELNEHVLSVANTRQRPGSP